jgi:hypothetical protein
MIALPSDKRVECERDTQKVSRNMDIVLLESEANRPDFAWLGGCPEKPVGNFQQGLTGRELVGGSTHRRHHLGRLEQGDRQPSLEFVQFLAIS